MKIQIEHRDGTEGECSLPVPVGVRGSTVQAIEVQAGACSTGTVHVGRYCIAVNHAAALLLALEAAIEETHARAVGP